MKRRKDSPPTIQEKKEIEKYKNQRFNVVLTVVTILGTMLILFLMEFFLT